VGRYRKPKQDAGFEVHGVREGTPLENFRKGQPAARVPGAPAVAETVGARARRCAGSRRFNAKVKTRQP